MKAWLSLLVFFLVKKYQIIVKEKKAKAEQLNADSEAEIVFFSAEISLEKKIQYDIKESEYFIFMVLS